MDQQYINSLINAINGVLRVHEEMQVRSAGAKAHAMLCQGFKGSPKFYAGRRPVYEPGQSGHLRTPSSCSRSIHASPAFKRHQDIRAVCLHLCKSPSDKAAEINKVPDRGHLLLHVHSVTCRLWSGLVRDPQISSSSPYQAISGSRPLLQAPSPGPPGPPAYHGPAISHWPPPAALVARARVLPTSTSESRSQKHRTTSDQLFRSISGRPALALQLCLASSIIAPRPLLNFARPVRLCRRCATPAICSFIPSPSPLAASNGDASQLLGFSLNTRRPIRHRHDSLRHLCITAGPHRVAAQPRRLFVLFDRLSAAAAAATLH